MSSDCELQSVNIWKKFLLYLDNILQVLLLCTFLLNDDDHLLSLFSVNPEHLLLCFVLLFFIFSQIQHNSAFLEKSCLPYAYLFLF